MMEKLFWHGQEEDETDMPPGFRFHPTDEELITHYLLNKVVDNTFFAKAIGEVNMNRTEPWELPGVAKMGEKEWYFFCFRDKKYPTGLRTNRATAAGYWKATGKDKEIFRGRLLVGKKKTLVFYMGRAPKGEKTNWIIHEFRLESLFSLQNLPKSVKNEWVICRVSHKTSDGKKVHFSELKKKDSGGGATSLPPLMDSPAWVALGGRIINPNISEWTESTHVPCFSNPIEIQITHNTMVNHFLNDPISSSNPSSNSLLESQYDPLLKQFHPVPPFSVHDQSILRGLVDTYDYGSKMKVTVSQDTGVISEKNIEISWIPEKGKRGIEDEEAPSTSAGPVDLACLWNY